MTLLFLKCKNDKICEIPESLNLPCFNNDVTTLTKNDSYIKMFFEMSRTTDLELFSRKNRQKKVANTIFTINFVLTEYIPILPPNLLF